MLDKINLIIIYGKKGSYKSSLGTILVNGLDGIACYIDLEENRHLKHFDNIKIFNDKNLISNDFIKEAIEDYDIVALDSYEALELKTDDLIYFKELAKASQTKLIVLTNSDVNDDVKEIADLLIHSRRN